MKTYSFSEPNKRGSGLEHMVSCMLRTMCDFEVIAPYRTGTRSTIDGCLISVDGYILPCESHPNGLMYECKWQDSSGSAHKRLPFHIIDAQAGVYASPLLFIIDGEFFASNPAGINTVEFMKKNVDGKRILGVMSSQEFITWCQRAKGCFNVSTNAS